jgi:hypothetical protein
LYQQLSRELVSPLVQGFHRHGCKVPCSSALSNKEAASAPKKRITPFVIFQRDSLLIGICLGAYNGFTRDTIGSPLSLMLSILVPAIAWAAFFAYLFSPFVFAVVERLGFVKQLHRPATRALGIQLMFSLSVATASEAANWLQGRSCSLPRFVCLCVLCMLLPDVVRRVAPRTLLYLCGLSAAQAVLDLWNARYWTCAFWFVSLIVLVVRFQLVGCDWTIHAFPKKGGRNSWRKWALRRIVLFVMAVPFGFLCWVCWLEWQTQIAMYSPFKPREPTVRLICDLRSRYSAHPNADHAPNAERALTTLIVFAQNEPVGVCAPGVLNTSCLDWANGVLHRFEEYLSCHPEEKRALDALNIIIPNQTELWDSSSGAEHATIAIRMNSPSQPETVYYLDSGWVAGWVGVPFDEEEIRRTHRKQPSQLVEIGWTQRAGGNWLWGLIRGADDLSTGSTSQIRTP